jgi:hypothetical protein
LGCTKVVFDDEDRNCVVPGNDNGPEHPGFREDEMIALLTDTAEPIVLEHAFEDLKGV